MPDSARKAVNLTRVSLVDLLSPERVLLLDVTTKSEALDALIEALAQAPEVQDREELARAVYERESLMSTGIGWGIAVPHVRLASVADIVVAMALNKRDIPDYQSLDERPVRIICMVAAREDQHAQYLKTLSALSTLINNQQVRDALLAAESPAQAFATISGRG